MTTTPATSLRTEQGRFRDKWITAITYQRRLAKSGGPTTVSSWEGFETVGELRKTDNLRLVLPIRGSGPFHRLIERLAKEVYFYKRFQDEIVPRNRAFELTIETVAAANSRLKKAQVADSPVKAEISHSLDRCAMVLDQTVTVLKERQKSYWETSLLALPEEREKWAVYLDDQKQVHSIPPRELAQFERIFDGARYPRRLVKRIDLDKRFQIRVALILRSYVPLRFDSIPTYGILKLPGVSLRTISRLTVLAYKCGELGEEKEDHLVVKGRKAPITVAGVYQKLRSAGLK